MTMTGAWIFPLRSNARRTNMCPAMFMPMSLRIRKNGRSRSLMAPNLEKLVKKVDPDDNPIIMIVKLKE